MSYQVQEITNFKSGIDVSLDPILSPSDAFINLDNGFVHRGVLNSRKGLHPFADGVDSANRQISRVSNEVTAESVGNSVNANDQSFNLANGQVERTNITVDVTDAVFGALQIVISYDPETRLVSFTGNVLGAGTNTINYDTGAVAVSFDADGGGAALTGGDAITVTYNYHPDLAIMGIHEYVQTPSPKDLIVCDEDFPYIYNGTNNDFDRIPFAGGVGPFTGSTNNFFTFQNWRLHSRGAVPAAAGALALSDVLFLTNNVDAPFVYDGTSIDLVSNMPEFRAPAEGAINRALHVLSYGERLIWLRPRLGGQDFAQAVLWGPINDSTGLALDYQGSGSGLLSAATDSIITGWHWLHDTLIVFFESDVYALELTDDAFAPYRWTKLEYERGSEATHGTVGYFGRVEAVGKLGIIGTDGRRTGRVDNKIPNFTRDNIDPVLIDHVFGDEMERDSQFWWTYPALDDPDLTRSNKILVKNFEEENFANFDLPLSVFNKTIVGDNTVWDNLPDCFGGTDALPIVDDSDPPSPITDIAYPIADVTWDRWGLDQDRYKTIAGDHKGFIFTLDRSFNDGYALISPKLSGSSAVTLGATTTVELEYHHFEVGDIVRFDNVDGTVELNGLIATITSVPDNSSIVVDINSTNFTAWTQNGQVTKLVDFKVEFVPFSPGRPLGQTTQIGKMDFLVRSGTGEYTIDFYEDRIDDTWTEPDKTYTFSSGIDEKRDRWFSIYVDNKADFHRWRIRQLKADEQALIKSIRVYFKLGGESNI